ncbi:MAG: hypothetical protein JWN44_6900 [Myxococcales bacterium]|nr:hypothetical protein [Myxococcales bacterium]
MCRFGPSPERVVALLDHATRAARSWIADDVLGRMLLAETDVALAERLRRAAGDSPAEALSSSAGDATALSPAIAPATTELWRVVAEAHLPRLACALLAPDALSDAAEILLDAELLDALPDVAILSGDGTASELELVGYVMARVDLLHDPAGVSRRLDDTADIDYARAGADEVLRHARAHLVRADAALHVRRLPVPFELLDHIANECPRWRYAQRVRLCVAMRMSSELGVTLLDGYLERFGNEAALWRSLLACVDRATPLFDRLRHRLCAEVTTSERDAVAWAALVDTLQAPAATAELMARRHSHRQTEASS